jgi:hypothetical protein
MLDYVLSQHSGGFVMARLFTAMMTVLAALVAPTAAIAQDPDVSCGPDEVAYYRCGAILVILKEDTADSLGRSGSPTCRQVRPAQFDLVFADNPDPDH